MKNIELGIMQGRLLPKYKNRYQAHPVGYWSDEFEIARKLGLKSIEFIFDYNDYKLNPLMNENGINQISKISKNTGVNVKSICADYFMEAPLHSSNQKVKEKSVQVLKTLIKNSSLLNISDIVIPCVDQSSLKNNIDKERLINSLYDSVIYASKFNINIALETDLNPKDFLDLLNEFRLENLTVNYDTGNSASLGYNINQEFEYYGNKISDIHIKDRVLNGGSVMLGTGNTDFKSFFKILSNMEFNGPIILQAYRDNQGINVLKKQLNWFENKLMT
tara:strand:+ start:76 stop:903 length:828 start_codon:yes stop_codon:yes gene_type:complete